MQVLKNAWYAAARSDEIESELLNRVILGESLVFFRDPQGSVATLFDRCPHRFAPLRMGKVVNGHLQCPYHGLQFDRDGQCVFNPDGDGLTPQAACVRTYPTVEKFGLVWIWMGDPVSAQPGLLPEAPFMSDLAYRPVSGYKKIAVNYRYLIDNLVDAAHLFTVHGDTLGCAGLARAKTTVVREGRGIWAKRMATDAEPPALFDMLWRASRGAYEGRMDTWADARWDPPGLISQDTGVTLAGHPREQGLHTRNYHFVTPETDGSSHYFWVICRNFQLENDRLDSDIRAGSEHAFQQDGSLLEALQKNVGDRDFWSMGPVLLQGDLGAVQVRRELDRLIASQVAEQAQRSEA